jgi:hypothetical protein
VPITWTLALIAVGPIAAGALAAVFSATAIGIIVLLVWSF